VAAVEFALMAPLLCILFIITVDFSRAFYCQLTLNDCARNGAHFAANLRSYQETGWVSPYDDATSAALAEGSNLNPPLTADQVSVVNGTGSDGNPNATVTVTYTFTTIMTYPGLNNTFNLKAKVSTRIAP
jgi:Flp pilus assembly protein TadG